MRWIATLLVVMVAHTPARAAPSRTRLMILGGGIALQVASEYAVKDELSPERCRWCDPPDVDASLRDRLLWEDRGLARNLSDLSGYAASPVVAAGFLLVGSTDHRVMTFVDDIVPCVEAVVYTQLVTQVVKSAVGRRRPFVFDGDGSEPTSSEDNLSFFSGHSALAFSIAVSAGTVAQRRGYELAPAVWASGLALAGATAYLRVAADRHWASDVIAGGAVGALGGYAIPRLTGSLPVSLVPARGGVAVAGAF